MLRQIDEAEGLEAALGRPHWKQHLRTAANAGDAKVKYDSHAYALIQRIFERNQAAIHGELTHAPADLPSVLEQNQGQDGAAEFDAQAPLSLLRAGDGGHSRSILPQAEVTGQITKVRPWLRGGRNADSSMLAKRFAAAITRSFSRPGRECNRRGALQMAASKAPVTAA